MAPKPRRERSSRSSISVPAGRRRLGEIHRQAAAPDRQNGAKPPYGRGSSDWTDQCVVISPKLWARATACARFSEPSLMNMCLTCDFTVSGVMASERAIFLLERPWAMSLRIATSRALRESVSLDLGLGAAADW